MTEQSKVKYPEKQKQGERKLRSQYTALNLLRYNPNSPLRSSYSNTLSCMNVRQVITKGEAVKEITSRCKTRACPSCEAARMAKNVAGMEESFNAMEDPYFVTLTKVHVTGKNLPSSVKFMYKAFRAIFKSEERKRRKPNGVRKAEGHPSTKYLGYYHYHFHVLIDGKDNAEWLVRAWIEQMGSLCSPTAQDIQKADKGTLLELSKYINKSLIDNDEKHKKANIEDSFKFMNKILTSIHGTRTIQPFGKFKCHKPSKKEEVKEENDEPEVIETYVNNNRGDWETKEGNLYCGFNPDKTYDSSGKSYSEKYKLIEVVKPDETDQEKPLLDHGVWVNKWPDSNSSEMFLRKTPTLVLSVPEANEFINRDLRDFKSLLQDIA